MKYLTSHSWPDSRTIIFVSDIVNWSKTISAPYILSSSPMRKIWTQFRLRKILWILQKCGKIGPVGNAFSFFQLHLILKFIDKENIISLTAAWIFKTHTFLGFLILVYKIDFPNGIILKSIKPEYACTTRLCILQYSLFKPPGSRIFSL